MNRVLQLRQDLAALAEKAKAINQKAADEKRDLNADEQTSFDALWTEIRAKKKTIDALENETELDKMLEEKRAKRKDETGTDPDQRRDAFRSWCRNGFEGMLVEQRNLLMPGQFSAADFGRRDAEARAAQSGLTGNLGGYLVPEGFYADVIDALKYYGGMMEVAQILQTAMGNDLPIPTSNDTASKGRILGESSPATTTTVPFGQVILRAYKYTTDIVLVPIELLQDSGVDIEAFIVKKLAERLGRIMNEHFTVGTGTDQPKGVVVDATLGKTGANGQTLTVIYDDLIDLKYSVNKAYRTGQGVAWMMADTTLASVLKIKDQNLRPLILDYLQTLQAGEPEKLLGQRLVINDDMAAMAVSAKSILYGDFKNYWIRRVMALMMMRLVERYADNGQIAFLGFMRTDGRMVDAGTHPIKYYQNAAS